MTREEREKAIAELTRHKHEVQNDFGWNTTLLNSLDAAIEALKAEPCEDCVSRQEVLKLTRAERIFPHLTDDSMSSIKNVIFASDVKTLPRVSPKPRTGHWIMTSDYLTTAYGSIDYVKCSCCGEDSLEEGDYCPNCGAKMEGENE